VPLRVPLSDASPSTSQSPSGVLGTDIVLLTLGITGLASPDPELLRAVHLAMGLLAEAVLLPTALAAPITGILLALGTR
jgi:hypothetical protein